MNQNRENMNRFLMVTPARNEEKFLSKVINSVVTSSLTPKLWVIVDDNSTDNTPDIVRNFSEKYDYIKLLPLIKKHERDMTYHYSYVCKEGFDFVIQLARKNRIDWEYIALLDADTIVEPEYFQDIINELEKDTSVGIASGDVNILNNRAVKNIKVLKDVPSGTARIWRLKCFIETDGYSITQAPDSISRVKAILKGWKTVRFRKYKAYQLRDTSSAEGLWKGYIVKGRAAYYVNKHPLLVLLNAIYFTINKPYYTSVAFLYGYLVSFFKKERQINDENIKNYYWNTRMREYKKMLIEMIKIGV